MVDTPAPVPVVETPAGAAPVEAAPVIAAPVMPAPEVESAVKNAVDEQPVAPSAIISGTSKEVRLQQLLVRYKADQITPEEYHTLRAAIIAEP